MQTQQQQQEQQQQGKNTDSPKKDNRERENIVTLIKAKISNLLMSTTERQQQKQIAEQKKQALQQEKECVLAELRAGFYCSKCYRSATELNRTYEGFEGHLERVIGVPLPAPDSVIAIRGNEFDKEIKKW